MYYKRKSKIRLKCFNYNDDGYYFVTICTESMMDHFGYIENGEMILNKFGRIVEQQLNWLKYRYWYVDLDKYVIMPNHIHVIIVIDKSPVGTGRDLSVYKTETCHICNKTDHVYTETCHIYKTGICRVCINDKTNHVCKNKMTGRDLSLQKQNSSESNDKTKSISGLVGAFKTTSSKIIHKNDNYDFSWQRSFHDHIITNKKRLRIIRSYIKNNPANWKQDRNIFLIKKRRPM